MVVMLISVRDGTGAKQMVDDQKGLIFDPLVEHAEEGEWEW